FRRASRPKQGQPGGQKRLHSSFDGLKADLFDDVSPVGCLSFDDASKLFRTIGLRHGACIDHLVANLRQRDNALDLLVKPLDDRLRRSGRYKHAKPWSDVEIWKAQLYHCW